MKGKTIIKSNVNMVYIILAFMNIRLFFCQNCQTIRTIDNSECFNIFVINSSTYRAGHFAKNKNDDIIVEYSSTNQRFFLFLYKNGKFFYENDFHFVEKNISEIDFNGYIYLGRYESANIFISTKNDVNKTKEYLLSLSSYKTLIEIYDIENNIIYSNITQNVLINGIFSYYFSLLESTVDNSNNYIIIYTHDEEYNLYELGNYFSIKKISFNEINENIIDIEIIKSSDKIEIKNSRIIQGFLGGNNFIYVIYLSLENNICIQKYNYDTLESEENQIIANDINIVNENSGRPYQFEIFRALYLKDNLLALIYFPAEINFCFRILNIASNYNCLIQKCINNNIFPGTNLMNDFFKIDDNRLVFITANNNKINLLFIDLYANYNYIKIRKYSYFSSIYYFDKELSCFNFNNYLMFTITAVKNELGYENYTSLFMIFGYANGTDEEIDISYYISDSDSYDANNNLVIKLIENIKINNNIFGYEIINKIKLIHIPEQLKIFNSNNLEQELQNGDILEQNYILKQNTIIIKDHNYYYTEYQFMIKEPDYTNFYNKAEEVFGDTGDYSEYFIPRIFFGRTNSLKFKLCHKFCSSCSLYGVSNNDQKCLSCLPEYQYDYYNSSKTNCVPEGYYYNMEINELIKCDKDSFSFIKDEQNNKTFCFPYNEEECTYNDFINRLCHYDNYSNYLILNKLIPGIIKTYPKMNGTSLIIKGKDNITFHLTTEINEKKMINNNETNIEGLSVLDLKECENILKEENTINPDYSLVIFKVEKETKNVMEKTVQYEIYNPDTKQKLNLSNCSSIDLNIPIELSKYRENLYIDLKEQGYDLLDINNSFYQDICTNYKTENGTDVLLADRQNDFYETNLTCQDNCKYVNYSQTIKYLKCECEITNENITLDKFKEIFFTSFSSLTKHTNYKFLNCYKLVFSIKSITKNYGSIIIIILFLIHSCILILYITKGLRPIKFEIIKMIESVKNEEKTRQRKNNRKSAIVNPPKKALSRESIQLYFGRSINTKSKDKASNNSNNENNNKNSYLVNSRKTVSELRIKEQLDKLRTEINEEIPKIDLNVLDEYELNNLNYKDALKLDKRSFIQIYCSMIRKKHLLLFAFCTPNDFNLSLFKISKIIFLLATNFIMNVLFFFDESIHKIYINSGIFNLLQQIPQITYSTLISIFFEYIISFLTLSEGDLHEIKNDIKKQKEGYLENINETLDCFKIKFIIFFIFSFAFLFFYWYFISAFCAVYENTQVIYIENSITSFAMNLLYSFIKFLLFTLSRIISLRCNKDNVFCECLYKLGVF